MIIGIYITISILSVMFFLLGLFFLGVKNFEVCMTFLSLAFVMFIALAFSSMQIENRYCENTITSTVTNASTITYTNQIICTTDATPNEGLAWFWSGMSMVAMVFFFSAVLDPVKKRKE